MASIAKPQIEKSPEYLRDLAVEDLPIAELKPLDRQVRKHSPKQIMQIADSIKAFGFTNPVLIDDKNRVVAGFGRVLAVELLGMSIIPAIRLSEMTEAQYRAYRIADNRIAENAGWDPEILALEFECLAELDVDLDLTVTGFATPEIDLIIGDAALVEPDPPIPPIEASNITTRAGDLWLLGRDLRPNFPPA